MSIFSRFKKTKNDESIQRGVDGRIITNQKSNITKKRQNIIYIILVILLLGAIGCGVYFYVQYRRAVNNPDYASEQELSSVLEKVNKLMELPQDETPTLATVLNKDELKDQDFFKNAENGDKVLVYVQNKKAVLYRPSTNKIIEVMPVYNDETEQAAASGAISSSPKVALYNGSGESGITSDAETKIKEKIANVEITTKENASKSDYSKTIVVDLSGNMAEQAKTIADALGGEVGSMPDGETKPNADILVIVAK